jgi:hypothetical protein
MTKLTPLFSLFLLVYACSERTSIKFDESSERAKIIALHEAQRTYHFEKMVEEFVGQLSDSFISVNKGEITRPTKADNRERFSNYFNAVEFEKWDDLTPPVIRFSADYSMAYTVVDKEVVYRYQHDGEPAERETTHFCWVAIYKRLGDTWQIDCLSSTNKPSVTKLVSRKD